MKGHELLIIVFYLHNIIVKLRTTRFWAIFFLTFSLSLALKLVNKQLPTYFNQPPFPFNNQLHHHETRGCKRAFVPRVNHEFSKRNIRYIAAVTYNSTSVSVIAKIYSHSLVGFSTYVKNQTIEHYNNRCTIEHCYSCRQR